MKYKIRFSLLLFALVLTFLKANAQADLANAFAEVEKQLDILKIPPGDNNRYFFYNEAKCKDCLKKFIDDFLNNPNVPDQHRYIICNSLSNDTYRELLKYVSAERIFVLKNSLVFDLLAKGLLSTSQLYLIKTTNGEVSLAVKIIG